MCGRYFFRMEDTKAFSKLRNKIREQALFEYASDEVFPTNNALVLTQGVDDYSLDVMKWGISGYHKQTLINARSEGIEEKKIFQPMLHQRCLIPCNGFYEWIKTHKRKQKISIRKREEPLFYLAGIYNDQKEFVIVTKEAQGDMRVIHNRVPVVIMEEQISSYLREELCFDTKEDVFMYEKEKYPTAHEQCSLFDNEEML